ncbi:MAG: glycerophosphodiester phosphodiesterase family protein [Halioglobus sp.]|nr:glycerophosphodiester phosphodiesterase family protein [Halioglobus sp.]
MSIHRWAATVVLLSLPTMGLSAAFDEAGARVGAVQLGLRPQQLVQQLAAGPLKTELQACLRTKRVFYPTRFSIGHRGAPLFFPEHTAESYRAAAAMGAGILECDVTFTRDRQLVCRHDQCDLHSTTNILETDLVGTCVQPPGQQVSGADLDAQCCTSDITLEEFKSLKGMMHTSSSNLRWADELIGMKSPLRDLLPRQAGGTLLSFSEALQLFRELDVGVAPELKSPRVSMPFQDEYSQQNYAAQLVSEVKASGIAAERVWLQSFSYDDVLYWLKAYPQYAKQVVYLDDRFNTDVNSRESVIAMDPPLSRIASDGVRILAPPLFMLLGVEEGHIVPSAYAREAKTAGLDLIGWTTERSGSLSDGGGFYYSTVQDVISNDGDILTVVDVLAQQVGVIGLFSDWPATTTFYANCKPTL